MSLVTVNSVSVIAGTISMPNTGAWTANLVIDQPDGSGFTAGTSVTVEAADGLTFKGVVIPDRTGAFLDAVHVRVIAGAGGMGRQASRQGYVQPQAFAKDVVNGILNSSGESISDETDSGFLNTNLVAWATLSQTCAQAVEKLIAINAPDMTWRMLADGTLWVGTDSFPSSSRQFDLIEQNPEDGTTLIGSDTLFVVPGMSLEGVGSVVRVEHQIMKDKIRSRVWTLVSDQARGIVASTRAISRMETAPLDYFALYQCEVSAQSSDLLTVDVTPTAPNDMRIPGLQGVTVRAGSAVKVQFTSQAKVLLGWDGGDPSLPYVCCGLSSDSVQRIELAGNTDAARKGDKATSGTLEILGGVSTSFTGLKYTDQYGVVTTINATGIQAIITGKITEGSRLVGLG